MKKEKIREVWGLKRVLDISNYCELFFCILTGKKQKEDKKEEL